MNASQAKSALTQPFSRLLSWPFAMVIALAACTPTSNPESSGGSGGKAQGGSNASGGSSGGSGGSGGVSSGGAGGTADSGGASGTGGSTVTCTGSQSVCYNACVDLQTDVKNCGKCGTVCASDECNAGVCKKVKDCYKKTVVTDPLVADFEGYDGTTKAVDWGWAFNAPSGSDKAVYAGLYEYDDGTGSPVLSVAGPGNSSSKYAAKLASTSQASAWGGALGIWMGCVDATSYQGVSFWVKGTAPQGVATMNLATEATSAPDKDDAAAGGTCTSGTCAAPSLEFPVTTEWTHVLVKWDTFKAGTANGGTVTTTGGDITGMSWNVPLKWVAGTGDAGYVPVAAAYDLEIDDVEFIGATACDAGLKLCGTECTDTTTDQDNCGTCGNKCADPHTCSGGKCVCSSPYTDCSGTCVNLQIDAQNCGGCGKSCSGQCSGGSCQASTCTANMPQQNKQTNKGDNIDLGKYFINNNWWGDASASGSQSIWSTCSSGNTIGWGTEWNWSGGSGVISYASAVLGWHYGWKMSNTGLPIQLSAGKTITCGWTYRVQAGQTINVSYDLFAHTQSNPTESQEPSDEIMIWLYRAGGAAPIGGTVASVNIGGSSWELHQGSNGRWQVHSYVRTSNADTGATLVISDFLKDLTTSRGLSASKYLSSIQSGTEVYQGSGRLDTDQYYCVIQ